MTFPKGLLLSAKYSQGELSYFLVKGEWGHGTSRWHHIVTTRLTIVRSHFQHNYKNRFANIQHDSLILEMKEAETAQMREMHLHLRNFC